MLMSVALDMKVSGLLIGYFPPFLPAVFLSWGNPLSSFGFGVLLVRLVPVGLGGVAVR
jgi:hypothetical protein